MKKAVSNKQPKGADRGGAGASAELNGKVALVTGASRGLGRGIALVLAEKGADVLINYRSNREQAQETARHVRDMGRRALVVRADVSRSAEVTRMFKRLLDTFGRLDILVNNAGTSQPKDIFEISLADWHRILNTNLTSCFLCSKAAMEIMKKQQSGRIVNISSVVGQRGALFGHVHYASTKGGMLAFTKTLARTAAPLGITVNAVAPAITETELLWETLGRKRVKELAAKSPLGLGQPRDVGLCVAFLCGEAGDRITGATVDLNGGAYMR